MYEWVKVIHFIAVISWMVGMLYLPRLFVYHADAKNDTVLDATFQKMEWRLLRFIMTPAMLVTWLSGLTLLYFGAWFSDGWMHAKLLLVILMSALHGYFTRQVKIFARGENQKQARYFRLINEVPTVGMILVIILVVIKPF